MKPGFHQRRRELAEYQRRLKIRVALSNVMDRSNRLSRESMLIRQWVIFESLSAME